MLLCSSEIQAMQASSEHSRILKFETSLQWRLPLSWPLTKGYKNHEDKECTRHWQQTSSERHDDSAQRRELAENPDDLSKQRETLSVQGI